MFSLSCTLERWPSMLMSSRSPYQWPNCLEPLTKRCQAQTAAWADAWARHMTRRQPVCRYEVRLGHSANQIFNHSTIYSRHMTWEMPVCDCPSCFFTVLNVFKYCPQDCLIAVCHGLPLTALHFTAFILQPIISSLWSEHTLCQDFSTLHFAFIYFMKSSFR